MQFIQSQKAVCLHRDVMKALVLVVAVIAASSGSALAASVTNRDDKPVVLVVVEGDSKMDVPLDPGASEDICPSGCFLTTPDGDRIGLEGGETIDIVKGSAVIQ